MKSKTVIIIGSSRSNGDTKKIVDYLNSNNQFDIIDLNLYDISYYDYDHKNSSDDFLPLMQKIILNYQTIVFATPVYWYSMSGIMKVFFDRLSDLLTIEKDLGRQLRGKNMAMLSVNNANDLKNGFNMPFLESANYLGMNYLGDVHTWIESETLTTQVKVILDGFKELII